MKILEINSVCGIGSTGRICTDIAKVLSENNHECYIAYGREKAPDEYEHIAKRIGNNRDVNFHVIKSRIFDNSGFGSKRATKKFIKWIIELNPDIIHLHNIHGYYINVEILFNFLKEFNKPVIWTLHDCWPFTGHCTYFDFANCNKWKNNKCGSCPQKMKYPTSLFFDASSRNYEKKKLLFNSIDNLTIVTPSKWLALLVGQSFLKDHAIEVINNGIELNTFKKTNTNVRDKYGLTGKRIILAVADGWGPRKGLNDIIRLSKILPEDNKIIMVGLNGNEQEKIPENIITISRTNNVQELVDLYSSADVFINPTYEDNYPTVNLEAQACGTPVITYRTGGSVESVPQSNIVNVGDIEALAEKVLNSNILEIKDRDNFDKNIAYTKYLELYKNVIEASGK